MLARGASPFLLLPLGLLAFAVALAASGRDGVALAGGVAGVLLLALFMLFFRDPDRAVADGVASPADGQVLAVEHAADGLRVAIFMAPWSVHVNRAPIGGRVVRTAHRRGSHKPAFSKASAGNERFELTIQGPDGTVDVALVAGTVARRIHPYVGTGDTVERGQRIGLIAFGSRCEVRLPAGHLPLTPPGAWIRAGTTPIARKVPPR